MYVAGLNGGRFATKKLLKETVRAGREVDFINYAGPNSYTSETLPEGEVLTLVGPTEYQRNWYANVEKRKGKVRVS